MLRMFGQSLFFDGGCQQIATTAIVPFNTGLWTALLAGVLWLVWWVAPDSEESSFRPDGMVRTSDVHLLPKDLDEKVSELHLPALGAELTVLTQVTQRSRLKALSRVSTTVIGL